MTSTELYLGIIQFIVLLLSLSVHESAHAWTADALGDPTARYLGRVSLNPVVHVDPFGTLLLPLIGVFFLGGAMFGWAKPVPVNINRLRNPSRDHMLVAAAGPISNLMLAALFFIVLMVGKLLSADSARLLTQFVYGIAADGHTVLTPLIAFAYYGVVINLVLAVFNLIPIMPLDGAAVLYGLLPGSLSSAFSQMQSYGFILILGLLYLGIPEMLYRPVINFVQSFLVA